MTTPETFKVRDLSSGHIHEIPATASVYPVPRGFDREVGGIDVLPGNSNTSLGDWFEKYGTTALCMIESDDPTDKPEEHPGCVLAWLSEIIEPEEA